MLVLSRGPAEKIVFPHLGITVEILRVLGNRVRVGIEAPRHISIQRHEVAETQEHHGVDQPAEPVVDSNDNRLSHQQRNRLHTAQLALKLLQRQLEAGLPADSAETLQKALREFDAIDEEFKTASSPTPAAKERVARRALLVEDNQNEAELLSGYLRLAGYDVDTAADGLKALIYLSRHRPPDVVLLDMHMPELDGPETIRSIRKNPELQGVKVFAVTGSSESEAGVSVGPGGVDRWFRKPVNPEQLVSEMRRELEAV